MPTTSTTNYSGLLTERTDKMPLTEKQEKFFRAREHGWMPKGGFKTKNVISSDKAKELLEEAKRTGQKKAIKE